MSLAAYQERVLRICFDRQPAEADLAEMVMPERWLIYRSMVRARLEKVLGSGLPRSVEALGEARFVELFSDWLSEGGPTTRYFWRVVPEFAGWLGERLRDDPRPRQDVLSFEAAKWRVRYEESVPGPAAVEFSFEGRPYLNPTAELCSYTHAVHEPEGEHGEIAEKETHLVLFRRPDTEKLSVYRLNPSAAALVRCWSETELSMTDSVKQVTSARGGGFDQSFIDKLGGLLADLLERGILLGSYP